MTYCPPYSREIERLEAECKAKDAEIARLSALVVVGREMATVALASEVSIRTRLLTIVTYAGKWRSLEGKE